MKERINTDLKNAMKNQNRDLLSVVRMVKGAIQLEEIKLRRELTDDEIIIVVSKQIKLRKEAIVEFEKGKREDLVVQNNREIDLLNRYMPKQLTEEEIISIIDEAIASIDETIDIKSVMPLVSPKVKGKADMALVSKLVKEKIAKNQ